MSQQDKTLAFLAGLPNPTARKSTKTNAAPKVHIGSALAAGGGGGDSRRGSGDADADVVFEEVAFDSANGVAPGRASDRRLAADESTAARVGVVVGAAAHAGALVAATLGGGGARPLRSLSESSVGGAGGSPDAALALFKARADGAIAELLAGGAFDSVRARFDAAVAGAPFFAPHFVYRAVRAAMGGDATARENVSRALSALSRAPPEPAPGDAAASFGLGAPALAPAAAAAAADAPAPAAAEHHVLTPQSVGAGFELLLARVGGDIALDVGSARAEDFAAKFIARAVADEIVPPAWLEQPSTEAAAPAIVSAARHLLLAPHACERLEHAWGAATGAASADAMKGAVKAAVSEYFAPHGARDVLGVVDAVRALSSPYFSHEVVFRVIVTAIDHMGAGGGASGGAGGGDGDVADAAAAVLAALRGAGVVSEAQAVQGARRVEAALPDLTVDDPKAAEHLAAVLRAGIAAGGLPDADSHVPLPYPLLLSLALAKGELAAPGGVLGVCAHCAALARAAAEEEAADEKAAASTAQHGAPPARLAAGDA